MTWTPSLPSERAVQAEVWSAGADENDVAKGYQDKHHATGRKWVPKRSSSTPSTPKVQSGLGKHQQRRGRDAGRKLGQSTRHNSEPRGNQRRAKGTNTSLNGQVNFSDKSQFPDLLSAKTMPAPAKKLGLCLKRQPTPTRCGQKQTQKDQGLRSMMANMNWDKRVEAHMQKRAAESKVPREQPAGKTSEPKADPSEKTQNIPTSMQTETADARETSSELGRQEEADLKTNAAANDSDECDANGAGDCSDGDTAASPAHDQEADEEPSTPDAPDCTGTEPPGESCALDQSDVDPSPGEPPASPDDAPECLPGDASGVAAELSSAAMVTEGGNEDLDEETDNTSTEPSNPSLEPAPCKEACSPACEVSTNSSPTRVKTFSMSKPAQPEAVPLTRVTKASRADDYIDRVTSDKEVKRINGCKTAEAILLAETDSCDPQVLTTVYLSKAALVHPLRWPRPREDNTDVELAFARLTAAYKRFVEDVKYCHNMEPLSEMLNQESFVIFERIAEMEHGDLDPQLSNCVHMLLSRQRAAKDVDTKEAADAVA